MPANSRLHANLLHHGKGILRNSPKPVEPLDRALVAQPREHQSQLSKGEECTGASPSGIPWCCQAEQAFELWCCVHCNSAQSAHVHSLYRSQSAATCTMQKKEKPPAMLFFRAFTCTKEHLAVPEFTHSRGLWKWPVSCQPHWDLSTVTVASNTDTSITPVW